MPFIGFAAAAGVLILSAGSASLAAAQEAPAEASVSPATPSPDVLSEKDKVVCRSVRTTTSRMATRVCETKGRKEERLKKSRDRQVKMDTNGAEPWGAARDRRGW